MDKHEQAKELYEVDGISLAEISRRLDLNVNTVKTWRRRDGWVKPGNPPPKPYGSKYEHGKNPNSIAALEENRKTIKPGDKIAQTHGLYSDHSEDDKFEEFFNQAKELPATECAQNVFAKAYANLMVTLESIDLSNPAYLEPIARVATMVGNLAEKPSKIEQTELSNRIQKFKITEIERSINPEEDPHMQMMDEYIKAVEQDAFDELERQEANDKIKQLESIIQQDSSTAEFKQEIVSLKDEIKRLEGLLDNRGIKH